MCWYVRLVSIPLSPGIILGSKLERVFKITKPEGNISPRQNGEKQSYYIYK